MILCPQSSVWSLWNQLIAGSISSKMVSRLAAARIWKLAPKAKAKPKAKPKAKAKGQTAAANPEPNLELQKAYKARAAASGGRASSSWPLTGGRYPLPLFGDVEPECVLGWAMISRATQSNASCTASVNVPRLWPGHWESEHSLEPRAQTATCWPSTRAADSSGWNWRQKTHNLYQFITIWIVQIVSNSWIIK